jgi:hypothetical protein
MRSYATPPKPHGVRSPPCRLRRLLGQRFFLLHLVRDPRAVCWSTIRLPLIKTRRKQKPTPIEQALSRPIPRCFRTAAGWWVANLACESFGRLYPGQYLRLSYEDVASSPREALSAFFEAVSPDLPVRLEEPEASGNRHQSYGTRMRRQRLRFADVRRDDGRQSEMAPHYRRLAELPKRSMLTPTLKTSGVTPGGTRRQPARCWANESADLSEGIDP